MRISRTILLLISASLLLPFKPRARAQFTLVNVGQATNSGVNYHCLALAGNHVYVGTMADGFRIFDISNPANPVNVGHATNPVVPAPSFQGIAVESNLVYLANAADGLRIYDVTDAANPVNVGHTNDSTELRAYATAVAVSNHYAYLANGTDGLRIYDASIPTDPLNVGHTNDGYGHGITVADARVYLTVGTSLYIYDNADPSQPSQLGHTANSYSPAVDVKVVQDYAYVAKTTLGLGVYNVFDPTNPVELGSVDDGGSATGIVITGDYLFLANGSDGLRLYDLANPAAPVSVGHVNNGAFASGVVVSGNYAFLANGTDGLRVYLVAPRLSISVNNGNSVISWPVPLEPGFVLQQCSDLASPVWLDVTNQPVVVGNRNQLTLPLETDAAFYRLRQP